MNSTLSLLLAFLNQFFMPRHNAQLRLLKAQIAILRARIPTQRIILSPAEKAELDARQTTRRPLGRRQTRTTFPDR
jgi:putative transposase